MIQPGSWRGLLAHQADAEPVPREQPPVHRIALSLPQPMPPQVTAGVRLTFAIHAACPHGCDLGGLPVHVTARGDVLAEAELASGEGAAGASATGAAVELQVRAPVQAGEHAWSVHCPRHESGGIVHEQASLPLRFRTVPHAGSLAVWDVPSPTPAGRPLHVKIGARCAAGCGLAGRRVEVRDETGATIGGGTLGETPWTGTSALYWTSAELPAPAAEGVHSRTAVLVGPDAGPPHEAAPAAFTFRADRTPAHRATVRVIDERERAPVAGVEVRFGRYMASTDEHGVAEVALPPGTFEVGIRKNGFRAEPLRVTVDGDVAVEIGAATCPTQAELNERFFEEYPWG